MKIIEHQFKGEDKLKRRNKTTEIILHCAATREGKDYTVNDIDRWHRDRGFTMIGYQFVIYRDGSIHRGRPVGTSGGHCTNHNYCSVGVCYIGGCDKDMKPKDTRTTEQKIAMIELVHYLCKKYNLSIYNVFCHNQFAKKACPSFKIEDFRKEYNAYFASKTDETDN